jgi:predicted DNA-binding mobile mystery protein A
VPNSDLASLELQQLSDRLAATRQSLALNPPPRGWIHTIRVALGMRAHQLGSRLGISQPSVVRTEEREVAGTISLVTLRRFANALDCDLVYHLVPRTSLLHTLNRQARLVATAESESTSNSIGLDWQVIPPPSTMEQLDRQIAELVEKRPTRLWEPTEDGD